LQVSMMIPSLATQIPPHTFRMTDRLRLYCLESATVSIVTLGASKPLMLTLLISIETVSLHLLETHDETGDDEGHDASTKPPLSTRHLSIRYY
jgi:hypothetical protein